MRVGFVLSIHMTTRWRQYVTIYMYGLYHAQLHKTHTGHIDTDKSVLSVHQEHIRMGDLSKNVKFETQRNLLPVLKIVTQTVHTV